MNKDNMYIPDLDDLNEFVSLPNKKKTDTHTSDLGDLNEFDLMPNKKKIAVQDIDADAIYKKNLEALSKYHPELVDTVESVRIDEERIRIVYSESGAPRIIYKKENGEEVNIHSADNPVECANKAIDLLGKIDKEGIITLFGFGLGYFAEEVFERFEKGHILLVYEAVPEVFKLTLRVKDITGLLESEKVKIVLGADADNFEILHSHHHLITNGKLWVVQHKPSVLLNIKAYENFLKRLDEEKSLSEIGVGTNIRRGKEFMDACFSNLHSVIRKPGVVGLKDIFKGCTAIVVSAGPSLDKNIHLLKKAKGKAVIVATGGALPTLISSDIVPDLVAEIDPVTENIEDKFQENPELKRVPFICLAQYTPELVNIYPGPLFINGVSGNVAYVWLSQYWEDKGIIECFGGSVAHLAYATAEYIGAEVIAFVGQDLSYKSNRMHTAGYSDDLDRRLEAASAEKQENILNGIAVKDIFGEDTLSIPQFLAFKISFENRIRGSERVVVNATEGGIPIDGAENIRLAEFIEEYCSGKKEIDTFSVLSGLLNSEMNCDIDGLIEELSKTREKFKSIKKASKQILKYTKRVKKLKGKENKDSPELNSILEKVQVLIEKVKHPSLNILVGYNYGLELYMKKQEIQDIDEIDDKWEMLDKQLERSLLYYNEIVKTTSRFNKQMDKAIASLRREKNVDSILGNKAVDKKERFYQAGMIYKKAGIATQAVKYLEAVVSDQQSAVRNEEGKNSEIYVSLAEMYMKQYRFYEAKEILTEVRSQESEVRSEKTRITELLEVCNKKIRAWEGRKKKMGKLLEEAEANYGSHLESGYFYFRIKDFEKAEKAYLKAVESQESEVRSIENTVAAYYGLAHTYLAMEDPEKAVDALEKAIEMEPENPILYRDLGFIAFSNNDIASAEIFFARAIELEPRAEELYKPLASLYVSLGEKEKAIALYEDALLVNPDNPVIQQDLSVLLKDAVTKAGRC